MFSHFLFYSVLLNIVSSDPLFYNITEKPSFFCWKVCPLYCSPRHRSDEDAGSLIYLEDDPYSFSPEAWFEDDHPVPPHPYHHSHFIYWNKTKTTTKSPPAPTTTTKAPSTEEPSFICMVCKKKCNYPKS